jgi:putative ABC transport system permease protein
MLKSYVAVAFRQLAAQRLYAGINVAGLAVAFAAAILVGLFVRHELGYDGYHANAERIYRVSWFFSPPDAPTIRGVGAPPVFAPLLASDFPEVQQFARIRPCFSPTVVTVAERSFTEPWCMAADSELLRMFDFDWLAGDSELALSDPSSIVLTESLARKYFGADGALGRLITINGAALTVTGVIRDLPGNTHLRFDMLLPMSHLAAVDDALLERRNDASFLTYVMLRPAATAEGIRAGSSSFIARHLGEGLSKLTSLEVVPVTQIHLSPPFRGDLRAPGSVGSVYASAAIAAFVVLIACMNFVNLATAGARRRAKEVGVRKAIGAERSSLIAQFLGESLLLAALAGGLALAIVELVLPTFGAFIERDLALDYGGSEQVLGAIAAVVLLVGLVAGSFPAFYLAAFEPVRVLKGDATRGRSAVLLRRALVGVQFTISIVLVVATAVVYRQTSFMRNVDLGYDKEQIVVVNGLGTGRLAERWDRLEREWLADPGILGVTASSQPPGERPGGGDLLRGEGADPVSPPVDMTFLTVDFDFFSTYGIDVVAGRSFSPDAGADSADLALPGFSSSSVAIVNERGARALGWAPDEAVGKTFQGVSINGEQRDEPPRTVVGVVEDVFYAPLREEIGPTMYTLPRAGLNVASLKLSGRDLERTLAHVDDVWQRVVPEQPIARRFLDDDFERLYRSEARQSQLLGFSASLAIVIACLGLFGLAALATEQRTKEIGIRRVLGGTIGDIVRLLAGELGALVLLANVLAWPVAYVLMRRWLDSFAYRIDLDVTLFVASGIGVLAIAWGTVAAVAARAAAARPIKALRYE